MYNQDNIDAAKLGTVVVAGGITYFIFSVLVPLIIFCCLCCCLFSSFKAMFDNQNVYRRTTYNEQRYPQYGQQRYYDNYSYPGYNQSYYY